MSKITTSIFELIKSELINSGKNEFFNDNQLSFFDDRHVFIKKMIKYDSDVEKIVNRLFFQGYILEDEKIDKLFKKTFVNRFLNREIGRQTVEDFSSQLVYTTLSLEKYILNVYKNIDKYMTGEATSKGKTNQKGTNDGRNLETTLPQTEVNLNVDNTQLNYGDRNSISRNKNVSDTISDSTTNKFSVGDLKETFDLFESIFKRIDEKCFLQKW